MTERHVYKGVTDPNVKDRLVAIPNYPLTVSPHAETTPRTQGFRMGHRRGQVAAVEELQRRLPQAAFTWVKLVMDDYLDELHTQFHPANEATWSNHS